MINFNNNYFFPADQVEYISCNKTDDADYPFSLAVNLKSGKMLQVRYKILEIRDAEHRALLNQISSELREKEERIIGRLYLMEDIMKRIDKRQLRMWKILKELSESNIKCKE